MNKATPSIKENGKGNKGRKMVDYHKHLNFMMQLSSDKVIFFSLSHYVVSSYQVD